MDRIFIAVIASAVLLLLTSATLLVYHTGKPAVETVGVAKGFATVGARRWWGPASHPHARVYIGGIAEFRRQPPGAMKCICEGRETTFGPGEPAAWLLATVHASRHHHQWAASDAVRVRDIEMIANRVRRLLDKRPLCGAWTGRAGFRFVQPRTADIGRLPQHVRFVPRGDMASHLQMKRDRLSWWRLFPLLEFTWARLCTQMAAYIENAGRPRPLRPPRRRVAATRSRIPLNKSGYVSISFMKMNGNPMGRFAS